MASGSHEIRAATPDDGELVATLIARLLGELAGDVTSAPAAADLAPVARDLLGDDRYTALLAFDAGGSAASVLTLSECAAVYAKGRFGEIAEFYVAPAGRSAGLGAAMIAAATDYARARGWTRLEVGAPNLPRWRRTVDFYLRCGFTEVGPRLSLTWE